MPKYSTSPSQPAPTAARDSIHIPFVVQSRIIPDLATGKRWSLYRNLEKLALRVETKLKNAGFNIATPVAFTPQFGDRTARLTIVGFVEKSRLTDLRTNESPTTDIRVINSGVDVGEKTTIFKINKGGSLSEAQDPTTTVDNEVLALITAIVNSGALTADQIISVEYNGVKYGTKKWGGRSFPS